MRLEYFQLIDRISDINLDDRTIEAIASVPDASTIFEGHFPGYPLMPGVLLIEAMAQTSGWLIIAMTQFQIMPFLAAVKEAKLRTFVRPGQTLAVTAKLGHEGSGFAVTDGAARVDGKLVCNATLMFRTTPFPNPEFRTTMQQQAARIALPSGAPVNG